MKVLLTGITGFVGSHVAREVIADEIDLYAVIREDSNPWRIREILPQINVLTGNLFDTNLFLQIEKIRPDLCVHAAWDVTPGHYLDEKSNLNCIQASINLANALANSGCKRFIGIGTCFEYDLSQGHVSEESLTSPKSLYAASKLALSLILEQFCRTVSMEYVWLRLFYLYGPYEYEKRVIPHVIYCLLHNQHAKLSRCEQTLDYLHIEDAAAAIWQTSKSEGNGIFNIASGHPAPLYDLINIIASVLGRKDLIEFGAVPARAGDPMFVCANIQRLQQIIGWRPKYDITQGLLQTINWWKHWYRDQ